MIKNRAELISHGFVEGRKTVLDIAEYTLNHVDPLSCGKEQCKSRGSRLQVGEDVFDLNTVNKIYAIGGGKATYPLAVALEEILGDRITDGFIAIKKGQKQPFFETMGTLTKIRVAESAHPIPDETSLEAGKAVWQVAEKAGRGIWFFV